MLFLENRQDNLLERKNAINKMVRRLPDDYDDQDRPEYPSLRLRPPFILQAVPDSTAADLPEPIIKSVLKKKLSNSDVFANEASLPEYVPHSTVKNNVKAKLVTTFKTQTADQLPQRVTKAPPKVRTPPPRIRTPPPNPIHANRSTCIISDDKDFEIPLEESLKAVEDFIKMEKELSKWAVGEYILALWKGNGLFYGAKILEINVSGSILIIFDSYDIEDQIDYRDMRKYYRKNKNYIKKLGSSKVPVKDDVKHNNKIKCAKSRREERLKKSLNKHAKVPLFKRSTMLRQKILRTYQKMRQQKVNVQFFSNEVLKETCAATLLN